MRKILATVLLVCMMVTLIPLQAFAFEIPSKVSDIKQEDIISRHQEDKIISDKLYKTYNLKTDYSMNPSDTIKFYMSREFDEGVTRDENGFENGYKFRIFKWNEIKGKLVPIKTESDITYSPYGSLDAFGEEEKVNLGIRGNLAYEYIGRLPSYEYHNDLDSIGYYALLAVKEPRFDDLHVRRSYTFDGLPYTSSYNHNNDYHINRAIGLGLINGKNVDGKLHFEPDEAISKSEYYTIIAKIFGAVPEGNSKMYDILNFRTIDEANIILDGLDYNLAEWAKPYVSALYEKGFITEEDLKDDNFTNEQIDVLEKMFLDVEDNQIYKEAFEKFIEIKSELNSNRLAIVTAIVDVLENFEW